MAQRLRHFLIAGDFGLIHDEDDDGPKSRLRFCANVCERGLQARDADGETGRWDFLAREAGDEIVIAPAAADGPEAHRLTVIAFDLERQLGLEHGTGIIFEATDDGGVDADTITRITRNSNKFLDIREFRKACIISRVALNIGFKFLSPLHIVRDKVMRGLVYCAEKSLSLNVRESCARGEVAALILAPLSQQ